ncbi:MAG: sulfite exporter TauE/SafE family protein [Candidatus Omnitrophica bacterium]|nr:sulfite exporter TauE/SafE family protein [Candidatus Omnitrophota bacterium]
MIYLIFFCACLIQALGGFGAGLVAVPLLTLLYEPKFIIPAFSVVSFALNFLILFEARGKTDWKKVSVIIIGSFIGMPAGVFALKYLDQNVIRLFIAAVTFLMGVFFLFGFKPKIKESVFVLIVAGILSGFLSGSAAMGGPPLILLMISLGLKKDVFRATLIGCFIFSGVVGLTLYFISGLLTPVNLKISLLAFLPALAGTLTGIAVKNFLSEERFRKAAVFIIILIGAMGTYRAVSLLSNRGF